MADLAPDSTLTTRLYTPGFVAPEIEAGGGRAQPTYKSDMYSMGATLYFCAYGQMPQPDAEGAIIVPPYPQVATE